MSDATTGALSAETRTEILNIQVANEARKGWVVNSVAGNQAVLSRKKKLSFLLHALLTLLTGGLWLIVVVVLIVNRKVETLVINVDASGMVSRRN